MTSKSLTVVVPAFNAAVTLPRCLEAVRRQLTDGIDLIVVDDGSTDETGAIAGRYGAVVLRHERPAGPSRARNAGVERSQAPLVLFVDADVEIAPDAIDRVLAAFAHDPALSAVFGSYDDDPAAGTLVSDYRNLLHHYVHQNARTEAHTFWAGLGAARRSDFRDAGGFDERFVTASIEDIEFGGRLAARGGRIRLDKRLQGKHLKRWTLLGMVRTDVFARARPWTRLLLRDGGLPRDLNLQWRHRASGATAWLAASAAVAAIAVPSWRLTLAAAAGGALATVALLNLDFYRFLSTRRGPAFALAAVPLHALYYLYASGTFVWCCLEFAVQRLMRRAGDASVR